MSSYTMSGVSGLQSAPLNFSTAGVQAATKAQSAANVATPQPTVVSTTQSLLLVPTKPPLSNTVLAELMGAQASVYGSPLAKGQEPISP